MVKNACWLVAYVCDCTDAEQVSLGGGVTGDHLGRKVKERRQGGQGWV